MNIRLEMYELKRKNPAGTLRKKKRFPQKEFSGKTASNFFCTEISSNSVKTKTLRQALWPFGEAATLEIEIVTGTEKNQIFLTKNSNWRLTQNSDEENLVLEDDSLVPIKIFRVNNSLASDGQKIYYNFHTPGFRFQIFGKNYAVLDLMNSKTKFMLNKTFLKPLTENEKDYFSSLILFFWEYYIEFECNKIFAKSTKIISG